MIAYLQAWNADVPFADINAALLNPGSRPTNLRLYVPLRNATDLNDLSGNGFHATGTDLGTGASGPGVYLANKAYYYYMQQQQ